MAHKGTIKVESEKGIGTKFTIELNLAYMFSGIMSHDQSNNSYQYPQQSKQPPTQ